MIGGLFSQKKIEIPEAETYRKYVRDYKEGLNGLMESPFWGALKPHVSSFLERPPTVQELWRILDAVWDQMGIETENGDSLKEYYSHPIWLYNGLIVESNPICVKTRYEIIQLAKKYSPRTVLDLGGGTGILLKIAHAEIPQADRFDLVDISIKWESYVSEGLRPFGRIRALDHPQPPYDVVLSTEVMEHLRNPFEAISSINKFLKPRGVFIGTWSFYPMTRCHLPQNFYLARIFHNAVTLFGFKLLEKVNCGSFIFVYEKKRDISQFQSTFWEKTFEIGRPFLTFLNRYLP